VDSQCLSFTHSFTPGLFISVSLYLSVITYLAQICSLFPQMPRVVLFFNNCNQGSFPIRSRGSLPTQSTTWEEEGGRRGMCVEAT